MKILRYGLQLSLFFILPGTAVLAQRLKPGFDKAECLEMLKIAHRQLELAKWEKDSSVPMPQHYKLGYRSPVVGLENRWDLWTSSDGVGVISVRGTVDASVSWLANLYAAMVPAKGELQLEKDFTFSYNLSDDPKSAVHVGFLVSAAYLLRDIMPRIDSCYKTGIRDFIVTGHSQGGAITFLLTSYLENMKSVGKLPKDLRFKTYSGAPPKVGNLFYAYQFESLTRDWAFSIINSADWVPETLISIQTVNDFNGPNPFRHAKAMIKKQKFPKNLALRHVYNRLSKPPLKAQRRYENYLGKMISKAIRKQLPDFVPPVYFKSNNYVRVGTPVILYADAEYFKKYPEDVDQVWRSHMIPPYLFLAEKL